MRIYELAKELGVDNKVVLTKAAELGFGKQSHSNSLDSDEADRIRRAVLRQAVLRQSVGEQEKKSNNGTTNGSKSEVITTRVDKVTGSANTIVESRSGNVIRRRKATGATTASEAAVVVEPPAASEVVEVVDSSVVESPVAAAEEVAVHSESTAEVLESGAVESTVEQSEPIVSEQVAQVVEVAAAPEVAAAVPTPPEESVVAAATPAAVEVKKPTVGPRILGKMVLPQKKVVRPEAAAPAGKKGFATSPAMVIREEDDEDAKRAAKKHGRKREVSRLDLVDYEGREPRRIRGGKRKEESAENKAALDATKMKASKRVVKINEMITVGELAKQMFLKVGDVIAKLMELGMMATINQALDLDTATIVAQEFEFQVESTGFDEAVELHEEGVQDAVNQKARPPIVTVMGHVDHGKTSLLDAIRNASVASREAGGITQHIGAYQVQMKDKRLITFIDTPGHAAFTSMRARGAQVTDIVILVVAADEGVMPQTIEALNHAKAAEVPIIVAMNKMDKPGAAPDRIKQQLSEHGIQPEDWGGNTMFMPVSAQKKTGITELLESVLLVAEVEDLKANPDCRAKGAVVEARQERGRGSVATILVQQGTIKIGDIFVCGADYGRVRQMIDEHGKMVKEALPSTPVEVTGFSSTPDAGDDFFVVESEAKAREVSQNRSEKKKMKEQRALATGPISLEEFARRANNLALEELNIVLKADVHGSVEAVRDSIEKLSTDKVKVRVLHAAVGGINESDIQLAVASKAIIVGFGVRGETRALEEAERQGIDVRFYRIIYELIDDVKKAMAGLLAPIKKESPLGRAEVRETFTVPKIGVIAGCFVLNGNIKRGANVRLLRDSKIIFEGKMSGLRRFKDDVKEVQQGYECGISIEGYNDVKIGDQMDVYEIQEIAQVL